MQTVILCGGRGTRAYPHTEVVPKPLLEIDGEPILGHLMAIYARGGFTDFVLSAGYLADRIQDFAAACPRAWNIEVIDTGVEANTAERISGVAHVLEGTFMASYADGLADVDLDALLAFHRSTMGLATLTTVPLPSQYGTLDIADDGSVGRFREKPRLHDYRINGGYFVFEHAALDYFEVGPDLERDVLPALSDAHQLFAFSHDGFWQSMDTYKDAQDLTAKAHSGGAPWIRARPEYAEGQPAAPGQSRPPGPRGPRGPT